MNLIKKNYIYGFLIIFISIVVRLYNLNFDDLWFDELVSLWIADPNISFNETIERNIQVNMGPHLIFTLILKYFFLIFGYNPDIGRLIPVIFGTLSVASIMYLARLIDKSKSWILIGFLISINYYSISYSQELRSYSLVFFLSSLNLIYFIKILEKNNFFYNLLFYLITLTAVCNHIFIFLILFSETIFLLLLYRNEKFKFFTLFFNIVIIFLSYLIIMHDSLIAQLSMKEFWIDQIQLDFFINYFFSRFFGSKIMGFIYLIILFYLLVNKRKLLMNYSNKLILFVLILINSYFIPIIYGYISMPILIDRYIIFVLIPILILISILILKLDNKRIRNTILTILILSTLTNNYIEILKRKNVKPEFKKSILFMENSNSLNYMLAGSTSLNNKFVENYIRLSSTRKLKLESHNNFRNKSLKNIWVMCYLPITKSNCKKPSKLNNNYIKKKDIDFNLIKLVFYENLKNS
jgi:uncharacterized membrane protein